VLPWLSKDKMADCDYTASKARREQPALMNEFQHTASRCQRTPETALCAYEW
jgi:hypothetical protein